MVRPAQAEGDGHLVPHLEHHRIGPGNDAVGCIELGAVKRTGHCLTEFTRDRSPPRGARGVALSATAAGADMPADAYSSATICVSRTAFAVALLHNVTTVSFSAGKRRKLFRSRRARRRARRSAPLDRYPCATPSHSR